MARRRRAPGTTNPRVRRLLLQLRAIHAEISAVERRLAATPPSSQRGLLRRLDRALSRRETAMNQWVRLAVPDLVAAGARASAFELGIAFRTSGLLRRVTRLIQQQTFSEVAGTTRFLRADRKRLLRRITKEITALHVKRGMGVPEARRVVAARMDSIGLRAFVDNAGRSWRPKTYAEMLVRTRTAHAYNVGTITHSAENGTRVLEIFDGVVHDVCADANGQIVTAAWALDHPIAHPNCVRAFGPRPDLGVRNATEPAA